MANRYIVHGRDLKSGQAVQKVIEADTAKLAEEQASKLGMSVVGSEVAPAGGPAPAPGAPGAAGMYRAPGMPIAPDVPEQPVWSGSPSQWVNFWWFVAAILILPIPLTIWNYLLIRNTKYSLSNQRLRMEWGVLTKSVEEIELYRVTDTAVRQSFIQRTLGRGDVWLQTSDARNPETTLKFVPDPQKIRESVRQNAEARRRWRRVAEVEVS
jgi:membrane protein YdbS with pleckstrin-like domain